MLNDRDAAVMDHPMIPDPHPLATHELGACSLFGFAVATASVWDTVSQLGEKAMTGVVFALASTFAAGLVGWFGKGLVQSNVWFAASAAWNVTARTLANKRAGYYEAEFRGAREQIAELKAQVRALEAGDDAD